MLRQLTPNQRGRVAEKIMEWGNLVFIGLVIVQIIPGPGFNWSIAGAGVVSVVGAYLIALRIVRGGG